LVRFNFRWALFLAVFLLSSVYFFVFGDSGILERMNLESDKKNIEEKIDALKDENRSLSKKLNRYREGRYAGDDFLDSGYIKPGEKVIVLSGPGEKNVPINTEEKGGGRYSGILSYLRILWVAISIALVVGLFLYNRKLKNREPS
jgi:cell division protein FtsB